MAAETAPVARACRMCGGITGSETVDNPLGPPPLGGLEWRDCDCDQPETLTVDDPGYSEAVTKLTDAMEAAGWKVTRHGNRAALGA